MQPSAAQRADGSKVASARAGSCALLPRERESTGSNDHEDCEETTMLQMRKLPGAVIELVVGTMIVMVHLGLSGAYANRVLPAPPPRPRTPVLFD